MVAGGSCAPRTRARAGGRGRLNERADARARRGMRASACLLAHARAFGRALAPRLRGRRSTRTCASALVRARAHGRKCRRSLLFARVRARACLSVQPCGFASARARANVFDRCMRVYVCMCACMCAHVRSNRGRKCPNASDEQLAGGGPLLQMLLADDIAQPFLTLHRDPTLRYRASIAQARLSNQGIC